jgi:hypothetical protein
MTLNRYQYKIDEKRIGSRRLTKVPTHLRLAEKGVKAARSARSQSEGLYPVN